MSTFFQFDDYQLDAKERRLSYGATEVKLQPKSFDVLHLLLVHAGKLVSKDELLDKVWKDAVVTPNSLTRCIRQIRALLNDDADAPRFIETLPGSGYRFIAAVEAVDTAGVISQPSKASELFSRRGVQVAIVGVFALGLMVLVQQLQTSSPEDRFTAISDTSIAVLPFEDISLNSDRQYLADGIADAVTHSLSRVNGLTVTARTSAFSFRGEALTVPEIARRLQVSHILEGTVLNESDTIRIIARLIESENGTEVWSESYRRQTEDIFSIQDDISREVATAMQINLLENGASRQQYQPKLEAFEQFILGKASQEIGTVDGYLKARSYYEHAVELDPDYAEAKLALAMSYRRTTFTRATPIEQSISTRQQLIDAALQLDPTLSSAYVELGYMLRDQQDTAGSTAAFERAIELNANNAEAYAGLGSNLFRLGEFQESLGMHETAVSLAPRDNQFRIYLANAYWSVAQSERAIGIIRQSIEENPERSDNYTMMVRWLLQLGRAGEALYYQNLARRLDPSNQFREFQFCDTLHHLAADTRAVQCLQDYMASAPQDLNARMTYYQWTDDYAGAMQTLEENALNFGESFGMDSQRMLFLVEMGHWQEAMDFANQTFPELTETPAQVNAFTIWPATNLIHALAQLGCRDEAESLADSAIAFLETQRRLQGGALVSGVEDAQFYASLGYRDEMLRVLDSAEANDWTFYAWTTLKTPMFDAYREDSEFLEIRERLKSRLDEELEWYEANKDVEISLLNLSSR